MKSPLSRWLGWRAIFLLVRCRFFLLLASVAAGLLIAGSECSEVAGVLGAQGLRSPTPLPAGGGAGAGSSAAGEGPRAASSSGQGPRSRALSSGSAEHDTAIVAFSDGTIYLIDGTSGKIYGSFSSGSPLTTSYQNFDDHDTTVGFGFETDDPHGAGSLSSKRYFMSCGDDGNLYEHSADFGKRRIEMTVEEYIKGTPKILKDGGVTLGSKKSTMFLVDAKSGKIVSCHSPHVTEVENHEGKSALSSINARDWVEISPADIPPVIVKRTDYTLNHFKDSSKSTWGLTVSVIEAYTCQRFRDDSSLVARYGFGLEYQADLGQCNVMVPVHQIHGIDPIKKGLVAITRFSLPEKPSLPALLAAPSSHKEYGDHFRVEEAEKQHKYLSSFDGKQTSVSSFEKSLEPITSHLEKVDLAVKPLGATILLSWYLVPFLLILPLFFFVTIQNQQKSFNSSSSSPEKHATVTRKKKTRKAGKNNGSVRIISEPPVVKSATSESRLHEISEMHELISFARDGEYNEGRWIGKLFLSNVEIAKGSNGTVILEGVYGGRPVAVKRLVRAYHDVAVKEIENLIASDQHPNIVRWFGVEYDLDFVYISLERCACSLNDLIQLSSDTSSFPITSKSIVQEIESVYKVKLDSSKGISKDVELWKPNGYPSAELLKIMRDVVSGLAHLHELGIIHRDIKPQNVLINIDRCFSAKLSDMGISKRLPEDMSSLGNCTTGSGSSGWRAPEQLLHERQSRAVDLFSLGCVLFFCMTKGKHPFGSHFERDSNILNDRMDLFLVEQIPEAVHLFTLLLQADPGKRPKALEVLSHPLFWNSEKRLSFLRDASDRVELEDREAGSELLNALESIGPVAFGGKWGEKLDTPFITDMGRYRKYRFDSARDLLRVIRNKLNHYRELSDDLQELLGSVPEGFDSYFSQRFPKLLIEVYKVMHRHCFEDASLQKYFKSAHT